MEYRSIIIIIISIMLLFSIILLIHILYLNYLNLKTPKNGNSNFISVDSSGENLCINTTLDKPTITIKNNNVNVQIYIGGTSQTNKYIVYTGNTNDFSISEATDFVRSDSNMVTFPIPKIKTYYRATSYVDVSNGICESNPSATLFYDPIVDLTNNKYFYIKTPNNKILINKNNKLGIVSFNKYSYKKGKFKLIDNKLMNQKMYLDQLDFISNKNNPSSWSFVSTSDGVLIKSNNMYLTYDNNNIYMTKRCMNCENKYQLFNITMQK